MKPSKIKIQIRPKIDSASRIQVTAREKRLYLCRECKNKYYAYQFLCPECLGEVEAIQPEVASLRITSVPAESKEDLISLLKILSAQPDFDIRKALQALPWTMIQDTDSAILQHWKEVLEGEKAEAAVNFSDGTKKKKPKGFLPLFPSQAPPPFYLSMRVIGEARAVVKALRNVSIRLKWAEMVCSSSKVLEGLYKSNSSDRILFSDFLLQIERQLEESARDYQTTYRQREDDFVKRIKKLKTSLHGMESEMRAVRRQVQEQL